MDNVALHDGIPTEDRKSFLRAEIRRLQAELDAIEEEERNNIPHKQLNLFDE